MDLDLSSDQRMLLSAIEPLLAQHRQLPQPAGPDYVVFGGDLDAALDAAGFYGDADGFDLEHADAALLLDQIAQCPFAVPAMASLTVAPALGITLPRPIALAESLDPRVPIRFLAQSRTLLVAQVDEVLALDLEGAEIVPQDTIFAYPFARLASYPADALRPLAGVNAQQLRDAWALGLTFEILGALRAAHALTVDYVKQRQQFKRAIGAFQAVQHRLAEGATHIEALHYLAHRAAIGGDSAEVALAASYAQQHVPQIVYDCHQFHGAMGLTLEYVLHHWTYKLKALAGELGGASAQGRRAARLLWSEAA